MLIVRHSLGWSSPNIYRHVYGSPVGEGNLAKLDRALVRQLLHVLQPFVNAGNS